MNIGREEKKLGSSQGNGKEEAPWLSALLAPCSHTLSPPTHSALCLPLQAPHHSLCKSHSDPQDRGSQARAPRGDPMGLGRGVRLPLLWLQSKTGSKAQPFQLLFPPC